MKKYLLTFFVVILAYIVPAYADPAYLLSPGAAGEVQTLIESDDFEAFLKDAVLSNNDFSSWRKIKLPLGTKYHLGVEDRFESEYYAVYSNTTDVVKYNSERSSSASYMNMIYMEGKDIGHCIVLVKHSYKKAVTNYEWRTYYFYYDVEITPKGTELQEEDIPPIHYHKYYLTNNTIATCGKSGRETYTCSCGDSYHTDFPATNNHSWSEWITVKSPTYTASGEKARTCKTCYKVERVTLPALSDYAGRSIKHTGSKAYYIVSNDLNTVSFKRPISKKAKSITIPKTITDKGKTYTVTGILKRAFKGCKPKKVTIKTESLTSGGVRSTAFKDLTDETKVLVPKRKLKAYRKLFYKRGMKKAVKVRAK